MQHPGPPPILTQNPQYQNRPFLFGDNINQRIILPNYLFEELKDLPDTKLSFRQHIRRSLSGKYTGLGANVDPLAKSIKHDLTLNINLTLAILQDEIRYAIEDSIGTCTTWSPVPVFSKLLRIVALASGRIFVGRPLSRDEEWIKWTVDYTVDCAAAVADVAKIRPWLRPLLVPLKPRIRTSMEYRRKIAEKLRPVLTDMIESAKRVAEMGDGDDNGGVRRGGLGSGDEHSLATWSMVCMPHVCACS